MIDAAEMIDELTIKSRAYNLLYLLGESPKTVKTLKSEETFRLINIAREVWEGKGETAFHKMIQENVPRHQLRYVATGRIGGRDD